LPSSKELLARIALWWRFELFAVYVRLSCLANFGQSSCLN
jgi:hypothetical protein